MQTARFDESTATFTQIGALALYVPGGKIETAVTIVDDFNGFRVLTQTLTGSVTGGAGHYLGRPAPSAGGGTISSARTVHSRPDLHRRARLAVADEEPAETQADAAPGTETGEPQLPADVPQLVDELDEPMIDNLWLPL